MCRLPWEIAPSLAIGNIQTKDQKYFLGCWVDVPSMSAQQAVCLEQKSAERSEQKTQPDHSQIFSTKNEPGRNKLSCKSTELFLFLIILVSFLELWCFCFHF